MSLNKWEIETEIIELISILDEMSGIPEVNQLYVEGLKKSLVKIYASVQENYKLMNEIKGSIIKGQ